MPERPFPWAAVLPALALFAFWRLIAQLTPRAGEAAEAAFLALPVTLTAVGVCFLARRGSGLSVWLLAAGAVALLPGVGGARALLIGVLCVIGLAIALLSREDMELDLPDWLALCFALQSLFRPQLLLAPAADGKTLLFLLVLPAVGAWAAHDLSARRTPVAAGIAVAAAVTFEGGFGALTCLGLLATSLLLRLPAWRRHRLQRPAVVLAVVAAGMLVAAGRTDWAAVLRSCALLVLVLPLALPASPPRFLFAVGLALGAVRFAGADTAVLVPAALVLAVGPLGGERASTVQLAWSGTLALVCAVPASYPWLRAEPLGTVAGWLPSLLQGWMGALLIAALALLIVRSRSPGPALAGVLLGLTLVATPRAHTVLAQPLLLTAESPSWSSEVPSGSRLAKVTVDSYLTGAGSLPDGTAIGTLEALLADGTVRRRTLVVGRDTANRDSGSLPASPWHFELSSDGRSFAASARTRWAPSGAGPIRSLSVLRDGSLPEGGQLVLLWVGASR